MRRVTVALVLGAIVTNTVHADPGVAGGPCDLPRTYFKYELARIGDSPGEWTQAVRVPAFEQLERVHQVVRASALLTPLPSYRLRGVLNVGLPNGHPNLEPEGENAPLPSFYVLNFYAPKSWEGACGLTKHASSVATVAVVANVLGTILGDEKSPLDGGKPERFYPEPRVVRTVGGYPQYENGTVLITRKGREPLVRVSQERWIRAVLAGFRRTVEAAERNLAAMRSEQRIDMGAQADSGVAAMDEAIASMEQTYEWMKTTNPKAAADLKQSIERMRAERPKTQANAEKMHALQPKVDEDREKNLGAAGPEIEKMRAMIRTMEAYLASLTPSERQADAYHGHRIEYGYTVPSPGPNDRRIVMLNPDYFERIEPRTAFQALAVVSSYKGGSNVYRQSSEDQFAERVLGSIDYERLAELLAR